MVHTMTVTDMSAEQASTMPAPYKKYHAHDQQITTRTHRYSLAFTLTHTRTHHIHHTKHKWETCDDD